MTAYSQLSENSLAQGRLSPYSADHPSCGQHCCTDSNDVIWLSINGQCRPLPRTTSKKESLVSSPRKRATISSESPATHQHAHHETNSNCDFFSQTATGNSSLPQSQCLPSSSGHQLSSVTVLEERCISTQKENKESDGSPYRAELQPDSV